VRVLPFQSFPLKATTRSAAHQTTHQTQGINHTAKSAASTRFSFDRPCCITLPSHSADANASVKTVNPMTIFHGLVLSTLSIRNLFAFLSPSTNGEVFARASISTPLRRVTHSAHSTSNF